VYRYTAAGGPTTRIIVPPQIDFFRPELSFSNPSHFATMPQEAKATADDTSPPRKASPEPLSVQKPGFFSTRRILGPVDKEYGDVALLVHSFVTGLVDAASFANWGVFVGMQTGRSHFPCRSMEFPPCRFVLVCNWK
jgi:hypothetical protein